MVIARALLLEPKFLICDEPTSALDASIRAQILNLLVELKDQLDLTLVLISHDLRVVRYLCDRVAVMYLGQIVEVAPTEDLIANPRHPYTKALLAAIPSPGTEPVRLPGEPASPLSIPSGCGFHPRCTEKVQQCPSEVPTLVSIDGTSRHMASCHLTTTLTAPFSMDQEIA